VSDTDAAALAELMAPQAPLPEDETDAVAKAHRAPGCDVLIADDAGASRELLSAILRNFAGPLDIREARNGQDAVQLWQQLRPRITLLDIDMPGLDGLAALQQLRTIDPDAFVAMVSGSSSIDNVKQALALGAAGFVIKPYKPKRIVDLLQRYQDRTGHALMQGPI
jgi:two-component system chemotaxis response regulator CheY